MNSATGEFDVIVIGGGAAGLSAAVWCAELGLQAILLESAAELGGQLLWTHNPVKNHLGREAENGRELRDVFVRQARAWNFTLKTNAEAVEVDAANKKVGLRNGETLSARALIVATGVRRRKLGVAGENEFRGRGILESGTRDKDSIAGKRLCIVGGGDAALENALILAQTASEIALVHRRENFRARLEFLEKVKNNPKVKIFTETVVTKIIGDKAVEAVELRNIRSGEIYTLSVQALLVRIGVEPNIEIFRGKLETDENGYLKVNSNCETSAENVFAVGDVANPLAPTVSSAVGMGATAAKVFFARRLE